MQQTEADWDSRTFGKRVLELVAEPTDSLAEVVEKLKEAEANYGLVVLKLPSTMYQTQFAIQSCGYQFVENQISLSAKTDLLCQKLLQLQGASQNISWRYSEEADVDVICEAIASRMFSTDRVYLDPQLGPEFAVRRYSSWIRVMHRERQLVSVHRQNELIGFTSLVCSLRSCASPLGGVFPSVQHAGLGLAPLTAASGQAYELGFRTLCTKVSSNNQQVLRLYSRVGMSIQSSSYVFVKHSRLGKEDL